jgi:2-amino-4-hydroxy-6-hydroxymethyldihydropteridine diphosphokinase
MLGTCRAIEARAGRDRAREARFGERTLDIDILLVDEIAISSAYLTVPHPRMHLRRFVLQPLVEIAPDLVDPRDRRLWSTILATLRE